MWGNMKTSTFFRLIFLELKNRIWKLQTFVYFSVYFILTFLGAITFAGTFTGSAIAFGFSDQLALNSPVILHFLTSLVGTFGVLIIAPIFAQSINRDFETNFHPIIFSTPINKFAYFFIKYLSSMLIVLIILSSIGLSIFTATLMPFVNKAFIAKNHLTFYIYPYLTNIIPNIFTFGAIFISLVAFFKKMTPVYIANILLFIGWFIGGQIASDLDNRLISVLIDPFGLNAIQHIVRYWSIIEESTKLIPVTNYFLYNRILWGSLGAIFLFLGSFFFHPLKINKESKKTLENSRKPPFNKIIEATLNPHSWKIFFQLSFKEFKMAFSNIFFLIILFSGILSMFAVSGSIGKLYGTETLPVTYHTLEIAGGMFSLFIFAIIAYYAGELIWRDKDKSFDNLVDSKPISNYFLYLSKLFCLSLMLVFLMSIILICCMFIQVFKGYYFFELSIYFRQLFFYNLPGYLLVAILALFVQTMVKNKYMGHFIIVFSYFFLAWLPLFGLDHNLYLLGYLPKATYSDMNGFGTILTPFLTYCLYWGFFYFALAILTILFWQRGESISFKARLSEFKIRIKPHHKKLFSIAFSGWLLVGLFIYYNTNIVNSYKTPSRIEKDAVNYEKRYKNFENLDQPNLYSVQVNVDIFPKDQKVSSSGLFKYKNISENPIQTVMLKTPIKSKVHSLIWNKDVLSKQYDKELNVWLFDFEKPIAPNEELELSFTISIKSKGFENISAVKEPEQIIIPNGTFFNNRNLFPLIGYTSDLEITNEKKRSKHKLPKRPRYADISDETALQKTYISSEGTWIDFESTVSTSEDQIAISPGQLVKEWTEKDRKYFHYKSESSILNFYAFLSARYEITKDKWNDVDIEIYHHPHHISNIPHMINSIKKSLDYYTKNFSPYQFKEVRIVEFPRYQMFAQAFPGTIPYSEAIGFIAKVREKDINYPFYVTAHEVAHQWWAHQVIGGKVQGATMLSESLAQYSSLMVQEKEYGKEKMKKFLKYELDKYLLGRSTESQKELPLMLVENQGYIHYMKGSLIFYALKDYLGEDVVNKVLRDYVKDVGFQKPPFTRSIDLVERFKKAAPPEKKYLIEDFFETITFYNNRTENVSFKKVNNKYEVEIKSNNKKLRVGPLGEENEIAMNDFIDIGIFDKNDNLIYLEKHQIKNGQNIFNIQVDKEPFKAGIDPINKLIDKNSDHLLKAIEQK
jgi:ABC-2 type transport system permease protein